MSNVYGGDEVGSVVLDIGHCSTKVGYAGEDAPRSEISSIVAVHEALAHDASQSKSLGRGGGGESVLGSQTSLKKFTKKYFIDTTEIMVPRERQEIRSFLKEGVIEDWELFEKMMEYIYARHVCSEPTQHPLFFSEVCWNPKSAKEKLAELMFEKFSIPALYLAPNAMLSLFSVGRPTGVVLDSGEHQTTAIPVLEGNVLQRAIIKTPFGGSAISNLCYKFLTRERNVIVRPYYMVKNKEAVSVGQPARWQPRSLPSDIHTSWQGYMLLEEMRNYKHSVLRVHDSQYDPEEAAAISSPVNYQFPDGFNIDVSVDDQYSIPEILFDLSFRGVPKVENEPNQMESKSSQTTKIESTIDSNKKASVSESSFRTSTGTGALEHFFSSYPMPSITYQDMILESVKRCDIDIRPSLLSTVVLVGGNTLLPGFTERITNELTHLAPQNLRVKVATNNTPTERKYSAWIGGSIMASLGTFQQLWISKLEYEEKGKCCIDPS